MSTTIAAGSPAFQTPLFASATRTTSALKTQFDDTGWELTPVSVAHTTAALRDIFACFDERLDPLQDNELLHVVVGPGGCGLVASSHFSPTLMSVLWIGVREAGSVAEGTADALSVFNQVQDELDLTQKEMLAATGIKKRTYHSWRKSPGLRPRLASLGRLWHLADALEDLREALDRPIGLWLHGGPERMSALREGRFDDLIDLAVGVRRPTKKSFGTSSQKGLAADVDLPVVKTGTPRITDVERGLHR